MMNVAWTPGVNPDPTIKKLLSDTTKQIMKDTGGSFKRADLMNRYAEETAKARAETLEAYVREYLAGTGLRVDEVELIEEYHGARITWRLEPKDPALKILRHEMTVPVNRDKRTVYDWSDQSLPFGKVYDATGRRLDSLPDMRIRKVNTETGEVTSYVIVDGVYQLDGLFVKTKTETYPAPLRVVFTCDEVEPEEPDAPVIVRDVGGEG